MNPKQTFYLTLAGIAALAIVMVSASMVGAVRSDNEVKMHKQKTLDIELPPDCKEGSVLIMTPCKLKVSGDACWKLEKVCKEQVDTDGTP